MPIIATFTAGATQVNVNGLHQWDYGQTLEIHDGTLPSGVCEVHFSCEGMTEAVVRSCSVVGGVLSAVIPDRCLEQSSPITAWVYEIGATSGRTSRVVVLPIIARTRPATSAEIPQEVGDKYTEAVAAMNTALEAFEAGDVIAGQARFASTAGEAGSANFATEANKAFIADQATAANYASEDTEKGTIEERLTSAERALEPLYAKVTDMAMGATHTIGKLPDGKTVHDITRAVIGIGGTVCVFNNSPSKGSSGNSLNANFSCVDASIAGSVAIRTFSTVLTSDEEGYLYLKVGCLYSAIGTQGAWSFTQVGVGQSIEAGALHISVYF